MVNYPTIGSHQGRDFIAKGRDVRMDETNIDFSRDRKMHNFKGRCCLVHRPERVLIQRRVETERNRTHTERTHKDEGCGCPLKYPEFNSTPSDDDNLIFEF